MLCVKEQIIYVNMLFDTIDSSMRLKTRSNVSVKAIMRDTVFPRRHLLATSSVAS